MVSSDLAASVQRHVDLWSPCAPPNDDATFAASSEEHTAPDRLVNLHKWISLDQLQLSDYKLWEPLVM